MDGIGHVLGIANQSVEDIWHIERLGFLGYAVEFFLVGASDKSALYTNENDHTAICLQAIDDGSNVGKRLFLGYLT